MFEVRYCGYNIRNVDFDTIDRPNGAMEHLFIYFTSPMFIELDNIRIKAPVGSMIIYTPGYREWYHAVKKFQNSFVHFTDDDNFCGKLNLPLNQLFTISESSEINEIIRHIEYEFFSHDLYYQDKIDAYVKSMLIQLARNIYGESNYNNIEISTFRKFFNIRMNMLSNLDKDWNTENMSKLANMSKSQFYHYYKQIFHQPPKTELIQARMEYSKYLLTNDTLQVNQIAQMIGYSNEYHFIRLFKKFYGYSPKQYSLLEHSNKNQ